MNKNEDKNKKLDSKELEDISGGASSKEKVSKYFKNMTDEQREKIKKSLIATAYGGPNIFPFTFPFPTIQGLPELSKKPEEPKNPDSPKVDALLPEKPENTEE